MAFAKHKLYNKPQDHADWIENCPTIKMKPLLQVQSPHEKASSSRGMTQLQSFVLPTGSQFISRFG
jgi:hypothetical protein